MRKTKNSKADSIIDSAAEDAAVNDVVNDLVKDNSSADTHGKVAGSGSAKPAEIGGRAGPDPTRYGDWEKNGRCIDF